MPTQRVLLIDDQSSILMLLKVLLERTIPGVEIMSTDSACEALTLLSDRPCELILTDVNMPRHDGFFVLNEVKRRWPSILVVLMSGMPLNSKALAAGADGFLLKPFSLPQLQATLTAVAARKRDLIGSDVNFHG